MTKTADAIRRKVEEHYEKALSRGNSCRGVNCCSLDGKADSTTTLAGYTIADLSVIPQDADIQSFGCGNPLAFAAVLPGDTVVDLGSGAGLDLLLAAGRVGPDGKVIGVDLTDEMLSRARENVAKAGLDQVELRKGKIEELPVESESVDWVISNCVINLSPEKDRVFSEIARVLKPGGAMLVSDIVADNLPGWFRKIPGALEACVGSAVGETEYLAALHNAGLEAVEVRGRVVYDARAVVAFVADEIPILNAFTPLPAWVEKALQSVIEATGAKVQSLRVYARKPGIALPRT